jgi:dUTP pyrophosphatase
MLLQLKTQLLNDAARLPERNHPTDAGLDIYASEDKFIPHGATVIINTGVAVEIPEDYVGKLEGRSGLSSKGIILSAGVIDSAYRGEIGVVLNNFSHTRDTIGFNADGYTRTINGYQVHKGDKIAQLLIHRVETPKASRVEILNTTDRGGKGYGSSGR